MGCRTDLEPKKTSESSLDPASVIWIYMGDIHFEKNRYRSSQAVLNGFESIDEKGFTFGKARKILGRFHDQVTTSMNSPLPSAQALEKFSVDYHRPNVMEISLSCDRPEISRQVPGRAT